MTREDIISLTFTPIMGSKLSKGERIINAIRLTKNIDETDKCDVQSILYAFASKFLSGKDLDIVKEELKVTELGKSLIEEGIKEGMKDGKSDIIIKLVLKKFKRVPEGYKEKIKQLSEESLDIIALEIFDINSVEELERYL